MGGAWSAGQIIRAFRAIGYRKITIDSEEVTEAYARKWGHGLAIRDYIQSSLIYAEKPVEAKGEVKAEGSKLLARGQVKAGKISRRFLAPRPAVSPADAEEEAGQETGDVGPPGDAAVLTQEA